MVSLADDNVNGINKCTNTAKLNMKIDIIDRVLESLDFEN